MEPTSEITDIISAVPLFSGLEGDVLEELALRSRRVTARSGEKLGERGFLPVMLEGRAAVVKHSGVVLRLLAPGDIFGALSLFSDGDGSDISDVIAEGGASALLIPTAAIEHLIRTSGAFAESYIRMLNGKIRFLNDRICAFTAEDVSVRLAYHLLSAVAESGQKELRLDTSITRLADVLGIGRASLYRALAALEDAGLISRSERSIMIRDPEALRRYAEAEHRARPDKK